MTQMPLKDNLVEQEAHEIITISRWAGSRIKRHQATQGQFGWKFMKDYFKRNGSGFVVSNCF